MIRHEVWLYCRFTLSLRDVEELQAQQGIEVNYQTIRCWTLKFGPQMILELPSRSHAQAFLGNPEAQPLFARRHLSTTSRLVMVQGEP